MPRLDDVCAIDTGMRVSFTPAAAPAGRTLRSIECQGRNNSPDAPGSCGNLVQLDGPGESTTTMAR